MKIAENYDFFHQKTFFSPNKPLSPLSTSPQSSRLSQQTDRLSPQSNRLPPFGEENSAFSRSVCFFDSGLGGLSALFAFRKMQPDENCVYYGDNDRAPYGNLPESVVVRYVCAAVDELKAFFPKALLLACNTATACALNEVKKRCAFPVLGTYPPLFSAGKQGGEGLVALTRATYRSAAFSDLLNRAAKVYPKTRFIAYPCDNLAAKIEDSLLLGKRADYLSELPRKAFSFVVLGCTHYAHIKSEIEAYYRCPVYDGAKNAAYRLKCALLKTPLTPHSEQPRPSSPIFTHTAEKTPADTAPVLSSDGKVLFLGSGKQKNRQFYEHSFVLK